MKTQNTEKLEILSVRVVAVIKAIGDCLFVVMYFLTILACIIGVYVGIFGYCGGHLIHYALSDTLGIPLSYDECYRLGLIPFLNIIGFFIAGQVLMWKFLLTIAWNALLWLLNVLPSFLREWSNNLK